MNLDQTAVMEKSRSKIHYHFSHFTVIFRDWSIYHFNINIHINRNSKVFFFFRGQIWWHSATAQPQPTKYHETWFVLSHSFWRMLAVRLLPLITEDSMVENTGVLYSIPSLSETFALYLWLLCPVTYFPFFLRFYPSYLCLRYFSIWQYWWVFPVGISMQSQVT